jgi:hypothetical protein
MAHTSESSKSAAIEHDIAQDRQRIEEKLDAIQQRMSPGQLVDEALAYVKSSAGGEYASNLGAAVKNNPIPLALMGVSLAWLMAGPKTAPSSYARRPDDQYPLATAQGALRRTGPPQAEGQLSYSHFSDAEGNTFRAETDKAGHRAGHFTDAAGKTYRGFADASGRQIRDIRDEAGTLFDEASGWLSSTWQSLTRSAGNTGDGIFSAGRSAAERSSQINETILKHFKDQPLVGGALAFAVGAAIGAALPSSPAENDMMGEASDRVKNTLSTEAAKTVDKVGDAASDIYAKATSAGSDGNDAAPRAGGAGTSQTVQTGTFER